MTSIPKVISSTQTQYWMKCLFKQTIGPLPRSRLLGSSGTCRYNCCNFLSTLISNAEEENPFTESNKTRKKTPKALKLKLKPDGDSVEVEKAAVSASDQSVLSYIRKQGGTEPRIDLIPKQLFKLSRSIPTGVYLVDKSVASQLGEIIKSQNLDLKSPVVEFNPGWGLVTKELIDNVGFKYVTCFEDNEKLANEIQKELSISVIDASLGGLPRLHHIDKQEGSDRISSMLNQIDTGPVSTNSNCRKKLNVFVVFPNISAINFLIRSYVTHRVLFEDDMPWSGVTLFGTLSSQVELICKATPKTGLVAYRPTSVFFQTLFKFEEIGSFPRQAFIPWEVKDKTVRKGPKTRKLKCENPDVMNFFRIEANKDVCDKIGRENLFTYWYFVRQSLRARKNKVIPELEKWIPGCGVRLIKQGYTIFSQFGSLEPHQILDLYLQFVSWPEFSNSSFLTAAEKYQTRIEIPDEEES